MAIMTKEPDAAGSKTPARSTFWLFQSGLYKRNLGRITRQVTFGTLLFGIAFGCWRLSQEIGGWQILGTHARALEIGIPLALFAAGTWFVYRLVNLPRFADFLIAVEAEMNKVSWPSRTELIRASMVVIILMFGLTIVLYTYDVTLSWFLHTIGVVYMAPPGQSAGQ